MSSALAALSARFGLARVDSFKVLQQHWAQLVGSDLARATHLTSVRDGVMRVEVNDPAIADHLKWMRGDLINAANDICGNDAISDVRLSVSRGSTTRQTS